MTAAPGRPAGRYGDDVPWRRRTRRGIATAVALLLLAWALWEGVYQARSVSAQTQAYRVVDDSTVQVTFTVTKRAGERARCQVQALSASSAQVGLTVVTIGPQPTASVNRTVTVRTQQRAVTGTVLRCARA